MAKRKPGMGINTLKTPAELKGKLQTLLQQEYLHVLADAFDPKYRLDRKKEYQIIIPFNEYRKPWADYIKVPLKCMDDDNYKWPSPAKDPLKIYNFSRNCMPITGASWDKIYTSNPNGRICINIHRTILDVWRASVSSDFIQTSWGVDYIGKYTPEICPMGDELTLNQMEALSLAFRGQVLNIQATSDVHMKWAEYVRDTLKETGDFQDVVIVESRWLK